MVFGGQAVILYGEPRLTRDIDITLGLDPHEYDRVLPILQQIGLRPLISDIDRFLQETFVLPLIDPESTIRIDLVFALAAFERQAILRSRPRLLDNVPVQYISLEDLIVTKVVAGRPRDLEDVRGIILKNPQFDRTYVTNWLNQFDQDLDTQLTMVYEQLLATIKKD